MVHPVKTSAAAAAAAAAAAVAALAVAAAAAAAAEAKVDAHATILFRGWFTQGSRPLVVLQYIVENCNTKGAHRTHLALPPCPWWVFEFNRRSSSVILFG